TRVMRAMACARGSGGAATSACTAPPRVGSTPRASFPAGDDRAHGSRLSWQGVTGTPCETAEMHHRELPAEVGEAGRAAQVRVSRETTTRPLLGSLRGVIGTTLVLFGERFRGRRRAEPIRLTVPGLGRDPEGSAGRWV